MSHQPKSYGTVARTVATPPASDSGTDTESASLLGKTTRSNGKVWSVRLREHFAANVSRSWADLALLGCYVITGLLDSSSVFIWGSFVSMQTGNTVYLGLGLVAPTENDRWIRSGTSMICFCLGSLFFSSYHRHLTPRKRWVLVSSYVIQLLMMIAAALLVTLGPRTSKETPFSALWIGLPIALIAFQAAGQAVSSRVLQYNGLATVVLTSNYCDLFSDPNLLAGVSANAERNRRVAAPILLLGGAMLGGVWAHSEVGLAGALWTAIVLKTVVVVAWAFWAAEGE